MKTHFNVNFMPMVNFDFLKKCSEENKKILKHSEYFLLSEVSCPHFENCIIIDTNKEIKKNDIILAYLNNGDFGLYQFYKEIYGQWKILLHSLNTKKQFEINLNDIEIYGVVLNRKNNLKIPNLKIQPFIREQDFSAVVHC